MEAAEPAARHGASPVALAQAGRAAVEAALAALEGQRATIGDALTDLAQTPLRQRLAQIDADVPPAQLRRAQLTVLFMDIVDATALASRLGAEDLAQVLDRMLARAAQCVRTHGGRVLRYSGSGLKAGFGTEGTREDDAAQAVQAGLDILAAAREHASWVAQAHGLEELAVRVGAHTGEVAYGAGVEADNTLAGDTVNLAARMEQTAPGGGLRISAETWAHVRGLFEAEAQPPLMVKGVDAPLQTYLVARARPRPEQMAARGIEGLATPMVGRQAELQSLCSVFARWAAQPRLEAVLVVAEAGIGKSRLLAEFEAGRNTQPDCCRVLRGRATPQTATQAFGLLRDLLAGHWRIAEDDSLEQARAKIEGAVVPIFVAHDDPAVAQAHAHLLGHLLGIDWRDSPHLCGILDDPRQIRSRGLHAARLYLHRLAASGGLPVMMQIEDLHWADGESLDFLQELPHTDPGLPLLSLAFTRPTLFERRTDWPGSWAAEGRHQRIDLAPLDAGASHQLALALLQRLPQLPEPLAALLIRQAEGNPYYMEELVKVLIDRGAIRTGPVWAVDAERLVQARLPTTLTGVLQARLDALPAAERLALQQASVVGAVFWDQALAAVDSAAPLQLPALQRRRLALASGDAAAGDAVREFSFHHQLLQQVTYGTVLKKSRREGHACVARWLAGLSGLRARDVLGLAAEHFELAGDADSAVEYHARAAEQAWQRLAHERLFDHVQRALALLDAGPPAAAAPPRSDIERAALRWRLLCAREQSLSLQGRRDEQAADLERLAAIAEWLDDDRQRAEVCKRRGIRALRMNEWPLQEREARQGRACAERVGDEVLRLRCTWLLAAARILQMDIAEGRALATEALADAVRLGHRGLEGSLVNALSIAAARLGDVAAQIQLNDRSLQLNIEIGDRIAESVSRLNVGHVRLLEGDLARARLDLGEALRLFRDNGDRVLESAALGQLSALVLWQGQPDEALAHAKAALDAATRRHGGGRNEVFMAQLRIGEAERAQGRLPRAREALEAALAMALADRHRFLPAVHAALARLCRAEGDALAARAAVAPILKLAEEGGSLEATEFPRLVELTAYQVLAEQGDARAEAWLRRAHTALMARAQAIQDAALRRGLLENVPHHREILAAWAARMP